MKNELTDYDKFISDKSKTVAAVGFEPKPITAPLFEWQKSVVRWAIRTGRAALFEDCGLGNRLEVAAKSTISRCCFCYLLHLLHLTTCED